MTSDSPTYDAIASSKSGGPNDPGHPDDPRDCGGLGDPNDGDAANANVRHASRPNGATSHEIAPIVALVAGIVAALTTLGSLFEAAISRDIDSRQAILAVALFAIAEFAARRVGGRASVGRLGLRLAATALAAYGVVERPPWESIDTFGISSAFPYLTALALAGFFALERRADASVAGAIALAIFAAFGGPFFIRGGDEFHALYTLLAIAAVAATVTQDRNAAPAAARFPFTRLVPLLVLLTILPFFDSVDRDRHFEGWMRLLTAMAPLWLVVGARDRHQVARGVLAAVVVTAILGVGAAATAILEGGARFDLAHSLRVRLPLFGEHPNIIAPWFAVAGPLILAATLLVRSRAARAGLVLLAIATFGALALTRSRAAMGGAVVAHVAIVGIAILRRGSSVLSRRNRMVAISAVLVVVVAGALAAGGFLYRDRIASKLRDSVDFRAYMWRTAIAAIEERPLLGYGFLAAEPLMNHAQTSALDGRSKDTHPHMQPLAFALGAGIPAALLYLLIAFLVVARGAARGIMSSDRFVGAVGTAAAASAIALVAANLLDQGLALHTSFPLHLGLLIALLAATTQISDRPESAPPRRRAWFTIALSLALLLVVGDRLALHAIAASKRATRDRDRDRSVLFARAATFLDPLDRDTRFAYAEALDASGSRQEAAAILARITELVPWSPYPWERLGNLEYDRRSMPSALQALVRAKDRDPTGPSANQWTLRIANINANLGFREEAIAGFAEAMRYDYEAAQRANFRQDAQKEYYVSCGDNESPIYLTGILKRNRDMLPDLVKTDPVKARRLATTLLRIEISFRRFRSAREAVDLYHSLTTVPWLPLEHLENELSRLEREEAGNPDASQPDPSTGVDPVTIPAIRPDVVVAPPEDVADDIDPAAFANVAGQSIIYYDEGCRHLAASRWDAAIASFDSGLRNSYDMVAEREYIAKLVDGIFQAHLSKGDLANARDWVAKNLYFHPKPTDRISILARLATRTLEQGHGAESLDEATRILPLLASLPPGRAESSLAAASELFSKLLLAPDASLVASARATLASVEDRGEGLALACLAYSAAGRAPEANERLGRLRREHPDWLPDVKPRR